MHLTRCLLTQRILSSECETFLHATVSSADAAAAADATLLLIYSASKCEIVKWEDRRDGRKSKMEVFVCAVGDNFQGYKIGDV